MRWSYKREGGQYLAVCLVTNLEEVPAPFMTSQSADFKNLCFSTHFLKIRETKPSEGWSFLISGEFTDRLETPIIVRTH